MKLDKIGISATLDKAEEALKNEKGLSPAFKSIIELLILIIRMLTGKLNKNSSSKPPTTDKNSYQS